MKKNTIVTIIIILLLLAISLWWVGSAALQKNNKAGQVSAETITVFYSPTCGCCQQYIAYLEKAGFKVEAVQESDLSQIKAEYKVPRNLESCHTSLVKGYVVEGHMPFEVIEKLLKEKPDVAGIALPGMPQGSPGMPGQKIAPFRIHAITAQGNDGGIFMEF